MWNVLIILADDEHIHASLPRRNPGLHARQPARNILLVDAVSLPESGRESRLFEQRDIDEADGEERYEPDKYSTRTCQQYLRKQDKQYSTNHRITNVTAK